MFSENYYIDNNYKLIENFEDLLISPSECLNGHKKYYSTATQQNYCYDPNNLAKPTVYKLPSECLNGYEKYENMCKKITTQVPTPATTQVPTPATTQVPTVPSITKADIEKIIEIAAKCNNNEILKNNNCYTPAGKLLGPSFCDPNYIKIGGTCRSNISTTNTSEVILNNNVITSNPISLNKNISNYFGIYNMPKSYFEPVYGYPLYYWEGTQQINNNVNIF